MSSNSISNDYKHDDTMSDWKELEYFPFVNINIQFSLGFSESQVHIVLDAGRTYRYNCDFNWATTESSRGERDMVWVIFTRVAFESLGLAFIPPHDISPSFHYDNNDQLLSTPYVWCPALNTLYILLLI